MSSGPKLRTVHVLKPRSTGISEWWPPQTLRVRPVHTGDGLRLFHRDVPTRQQFELMKGMIRRA